ncbi:MAG TPA: nucleotide exchange factor GrpE [Gammaproteobacteria bacterium]|nr:nucleotide exchange factor GrpE [Gammaproteobacteria bacterium]
MSDQPAPAASGEDATGKPQAEENGTSAALAELEAAVTAAQEKAARNWDNYLRATAELENLRKRSQRDLENAYKYALERFLGELLPVKDSLEMALVSAPPEAALKSGLEATLRLLASVLERHGVVEIRPAKGEDFNPEWHEAMAMQESAEAPAGSVLQTVQTGYLLNGRLLRPARVLVAKAPAEAGK